MITKLRIVLNQETLEVEGGEKFVRELYDDFKSSFLHQMDGESSGKTGKKDSSPKSKSPPKNKSNKKQKKSKHKLTILSDLTLFEEENGVETLDSFLKKYNAKSNMDKNVVFVEYLAEKKNINPVTIDHVWTCYNLLDDIEIPTMRDSLVDTERRKHTIVINSLQDLSVSPKGKNWLRKNKIKEDGTK